MINARSGHDNITNELVRKTIVKYRTIRRSPGNCKAAMSIFILAFPLQ